MVDGKGTLATAELVHAQGKQCLLKVIERQTVDARPFSVHIAVAPTKNIDRLEWFLEKATELGIESITPVLFQHSERKIIKPERLQKIIVAAMKQSQRLHLPVLHPLTSFTDFVSLPHSGQRFVAHCAEGEKESLQHACESGKDTVVVIGPEGDLSAAEIEQAQANGFRPVTLGEVRLRTETAALAACHIVNLKNE